jgi:hypothetical protein
MVNLKALAARVLALVPKPLQPILKAIAAAVLPLVSVSLLNGSFDYKAIVAAVLTAVVVYIVPNAPKPTAAKK